MTGNIDWPTVRELLGEPAGAPRRSEPAQPAHLRARLKNQTRTGPTGGTSR